MKKLLTVLFGLATLFANSQCPYPTSNTQTGSTQMFCINNPNSTITITTNATQYVRVNVVQGFNYRFSIGDVYSGSNENINIYNATTNAQLANASGANGATITNWIATYSGEIKVVIAAGSCSLTNTTNVSLTAELTAVGNTLDSQTTYATDEWIGHVYNWVGTSPPPGGTSPNSPSNTLPFLTSNYVGYYNVGSETITENFGGNTACFPVFSNGVNRTNILTEVFAVRFRMLSTRPAGCYIIRFRGDDGIRLYNDGVLVFDEWRQQGPTNYTNVLVYLDGSADLIFDYYEYGGQNVADLSIQPFNNASNSVASSSTPVVCNNTIPNTLDGTSFPYRGSSVNPTINFQWQVSIDNVNFTSISGATSEDYTPASVNATSSDVVRYYRRIVSSASSVGSCNFFSNSVAITTTSNNVSAQSATSISCNNFVANWNAKANASSYIVDVATSSSFSAGTFVAGYQNLNVGNVTSLNVTNANVTPLYYRIRAVSPCGTSGNSSIITVNLNSTTWHSSSWSNGSPDLTKYVIINGNYDTATHGSFECCSLVINSGRTLNVAANNHIVIENNLTVNGVFNVFDDASLVQINNAGVNTGNITYSRNTTGVALDYVFWSSPVSTHTLGSSSHYYYWNPDISNSNGGLGNWLNASGNSMNTGVGYILRNVFSINFNGVPHNGIINVPITRGGYTGADYAGTNGVTITNLNDNLNLLGNPYPSAISTADFINANSNIEGAVRIWTHATSPSTANSNPFYGTYGYNYNINDYIVYNNTGAISGSGSFGGLIAGGQGFFVVMNDGPAATQSVVFNNAMRSKSYNNDQFFKTSDAGGKEKNRVWLDLVTADNNSIRTLLGYVEGATYQKDRNYDAVALESSASNIYSLVNNNKLCVQGRPTPFDNEDKVPFGVKITQAGTNSIGIHEVDGLFENQNIYIEDLHLNVTHNLKVSPYSFYSTVGVFNDRFVIKYKDATLSNSGFITDENQIVIISNETIQVKSLSEEVQEVIVFDVLGRKVYENKKVNNQELIIDTVVKNNSALVLQITLISGERVVKKTIY